MGGAVADKKIKPLREWMENENLDAYLVPHADRFQSEYLPPEDERLAWLTGFTGSAGIAAILRENAVLFTDGRYTLQAAKQVDTAIFDVVESPPEKPVEWLKDKLAEQARIGFDPWLFTVSQMQMWQRVAHENKWEMIAIDHNPIDELWQDKPSAKIIPAMPHELKYAGISTAEKISNILAKKEPETAYILISEPGLVCWLLNMRGQDVAHVPLVQSLALLDEKGQVILFTNPKKIGAELKRIWGNSVSVRDLSELENTLRKLDKNLQIDPAQCPYAVKEFCIANTIPLVEAADPSLLLRACKNDVEIQGAQLAQEMDAKAFNEFMQWFSARDFERENITELDVIETLHQCRKNNGSLDDSFDTIVGFGSNGAIIHYRADESCNLRLQPGNLLLLDSGGQYYEGTTDVTRVLAIGEATQQMKEHYTAVLKGLITLSVARFPLGTTGAQLDSLSRSHIWAVGLDYAHGTGHGVGSYMSVHEGPQGISSRSTVPLQAGMMLSIEPGIYLQGEYGIRLENIVVVVADTKADDKKPMLAFRTLTKTPFDERLILQDRLSAAEKAFLKQF